jgi:hypothetical protein
MTAAPERSYCAGGCGASILDLVEPDGVHADTDEIARWTVTDGDDGYSQLWCPYYRDL